MASPFKSIFSSVQQQRRDIEDYPFLGIDGRQARLEMLQAEHEALSEESKEIKRAIEVLEAERDGETGVEMREGMFGFGGESAGKKKQQHGGNAMGYKGKGKGKAKVPEVWKAKVAEPELTPTHNDRSPSIASSGVSSTSLLSPLVLTPAETATSESTASPSTNTTPRAAVPKPTEVKAPSTSSWKYRIIVVFRKFDKDAKAEADNIIEVCRYGATAGGMVVGFCAFCATAFCSDTSGLAAISVFLAIGAGAKTAVVAARQGISCRDTLKLSEQYARAYVMLMVTFVVVLVGVKKVL